MATGNASTVAQYLAALPRDRRQEIGKVRNMILKHLPKGYVEKIQDGMIGYQVPLSVYPAGYHAKKSEPLPFLALASYRRYMNLHMKFLYMDDALLKNFKDAYEASGKTLDMEQSCIRADNADDLALDVISETIAHMPVDAFIKMYEETLQD